MLPSTRFLRPARFHQLGKGVTCLGLAALLAITAATAQTAVAQIAEGTTGIDATGNSKSEMAACISGKTQQPRAACIAEARGAKAQKHAGKLESGTADFAANAMKRCEVFKETDDKAACKARVMNSSNVEGSIASGGLLREAEISVPATQ